MSHGSAKRSDLFARRVTAYPASQSPSGLERPVADHVEGSCRVVRQLPLPCALFCPIPEPFRD